MGEECGRRRGGDRGGGCRLELANPVVKSDCRRLTSGNDRLRRSNPCLLCDAVVEEVPG